MFSEDDKKFLTDKAYSLPLEKFYNGLYYKNQNGKNGTVTQAYLFSNERLHNEFKHLRKKNPRVLTVGSSGDQLLYSLYYGAKDITIIDVNLYTKYWIEYKMAAIKNLSFEDFEKYFLNASLSSPYNPFDYEVSKKIFHDLSEESKIFWGQIFTYGPSKEDIFETILNRYDSSKERTFSIFYKEKNSYKKIQNIIKNGDFKIEFINEEFSNFPSAVQGKFDLILLSNIMRYVSDEEFSQTVNNLYKNHLNNDGKIQLHYEYRNVLGKISPRIKALFPKIKINGYNFKNHHYTYIMHKPNSNLSEQPLEK